MSNIREPTRSAGAGRRQSGSRVGVARSLGASPCRVLEEDPDLAEAISAPRREQAIKECIAPAIRVAPGPWSDQRADRGGDGIGLLVLEGLLLRRVGIEGRFGVELLGEGDLLRPWQGYAVPSSLPRTTGWRVLEPTRLASLDAVAAERFARYPELTGALVGRALERSRNLAVNMAIVHQPRVDIRLQMLFWHLADRWGIVRRDGIRLPLRLTHALLADLVSARRPTVSSALSELAERGLVRPIGDAWLLSGEPPGELLELQAVAVRDLD